MHYRIRGFKVKSKYLGFFNDYTNLNVLYYRYVTHAFIQQHKAFEKAKQCKISENNPQLMLYYLYLWWITGTTYTSHASMQQETEVCQNNMDRCSFKYPMEIIPPPPLNGRDINDFDIAMNASHVEAFCRYRLFIKYLHVIKWNFNAFWCISNCHFGTFHWICNDTDNSRSACFDW